MLEAVGGDHEWETAAAERRQRVHGRHVKVNLKNTSFRMI
jgi:hypothetical protein